MSTRCQIEFRCGERRRTVYRHNDGYPSAVIPDLLAFLAWSTRGGDVEYETANFLYWSKRESGSEQLGFGVCANGELHGDVEYYYVIEHRRSSTSVRAYVVEHEKGPCIGRCVQRVAVPEVTPAATFFQLCCCHRSDGWCPRATDGATQWCLVLRDDRLHEFRRVDNPHERVTFDDLLDDAGYRRVTSDAVSGSR